MALDRGARAAKMREVSERMESLPDSYVEAIEEDRELAMQFAVQFPSRVPPHIRRVYEALGFAETLALGALAYPPGTRARLVASRVAAAVTRWKITWDEVLAAARKGESD